MRKRGGVAVLLAVLALALAGPGRASDDSPVTLVMEGWWGGAKAADILLTASDGGGRWHGRLVMRSSGLLHWLTGAQAEMEGDGRAARGVPLPDSYRLHSVSNRSERLVEVGYGGEPPLGHRLRYEVIRADPDKKHESEAAAEPPEAERRGTVDPLSAILGLGRRAVAGESNFTLPVYDGRRRFDVAVQVRGRSRAVFNDRSNDVLAAELVVHPVSGFNGFQMRMWNKARFEVDLDPRSGLPLRIASDSFMVAAVLTTKAVCPPAEGCAIHAQ